MSTLSIVNKDTTFLGYRRDNGRVGIRNPLHHHHGHGIAGVVQHEMNHRNSPCGWALNRRESSEVIQRVKRVIHMI